jgi:hypothetical protein
MAMDNNSSLSQSTQNQPCCPSKCCGWLVVAGLVLLVAVAIGGYWLGIQKAISTAKSLQPTPLPTKAVIATPTTDPTAGWKTYRSADLSFKYPSTWKLTNNQIEGENPKIKISIVDRDSTLMNECMEETSAETKNNLAVRKFSRVTTGVMCNTTDSTPREIWVTKTRGSSAPGMSLEYSSTESPQTEKLFGQILGTFRFLE